MNTNQERPIPSSPDLQADNPKGTGEGLDVTASLFGERKYNRSIVKHFETDSTLIKEAKDTAFYTERGEVANAYIKFLENQGIEWFTGKYVDGLVGMAVCSERNGTEK